MRYRNSESHRVTCALLKELRVKKGMTMRQMSDKLNRSENFTALVESGQRMLNTSEFMVYTGLLGLSASKAMAMIERRMRKKK